MRIKKIINKLIYLVRNSRNEYNISILLPDKVQDIEILFTNVNQWVNTYGNIDNCELVIESIGSTKECYASDNELTRGIMNYVRKYKITTIYILTLHNHPVSGISSKGADKADYYVYPSEADIMLADNFYNIRTSSIEHNISSFAANKDFAISYASPDVRNKILSIYGNYYLTYLSLLQKISLVPLSCGIIVCNDKVYFREITKKDIVEVLNGKDIRPSNHGNSYKFFKIAILGANTLYPNHNILNKRFIAVFSRLSGYCESYFDRINNLVPDNKEYFIYASDNPSFDELYKNGAINYIVRRRLTACCLFTNCMNSKPSIKELINFSKFKDSIAPIVYIQNDQSYEITPDKPLVIKNKYEQDMYNYCITTASKYVLSFDPNTNYTANVLPFAAGYYDKFDISINDYSLYDFCETYVLAEYERTFNGIKERKIRFISKAFASSITNARFSSTNIESLEEDIVMYGIEKVTFHIIFSKNDMIINYSINNNNIDTMNSFFTSLKVSATKYNVSYEFKVDYIYDLLTRSFKKSDIINIKYY